MANHQIFSCSGFVILLVCTVYLQLTSIEAGRVLNDFIQNFEGLDYSTETVHRNHERAKRSANPEVHINFKAHRRDFNLHLRPDTSIFSPDADFEYEGNFHAPRISHIYSGELIGVPHSKVHGSIINGIFAGTINTPSDIFHVEKSEVHFKTPQKFHSVIYNDRDVVNAHLRKRRGVPLTSSCANSNASVSEWMDTVQNSAVETEDQREKRATAMTEEEAWAHKYSKQAQQYYTTLNKRTKRAETRDKRTCTLYLESDPMLWQYMTGSTLNENLGYDKERAMDEITSLFATHVSGIKTIYENTVFEHGNLGPFTGISFVVRRVKINTDDDCAGELRNTNKFCRPNIDVSNFLNMNSLRNHDLFCLAYVFTYRDFTGGTLGLAWVGSHSKASGGICERHKEYTEGSDRVQKSLNTGIVTLVNYGSRVPPKVSTLTFAHEVGHNFGSPHDGGSCIPYNVLPRNPDGNFIMYASATSGDKANNNKFSECSVRNMTMVLDAIISGSNGKSNCLVESQEAFCGNAIVETGEVCDCGFATDCNKTDNCCYPQDAGQDLKCTLKPHTECSPSQGPCCKADCNKYKLSDNIVCKQETECSELARCNGTSAVCPVPTAKQELTPCNDFTQVCKSGVCQGTICEKIGWRQCYMTDTTEDKNIDKGKLCFVACQNPNTDDCISTGDDASLALQENSALRELLATNGRKDIRLQPGAPCDNFKGYCDVFQKCRGVDADGPLARLKNLLLNAETLNTIRDWITEYWWAVLLMGVGLVVFMGLFIKVCAVHTPSSNPKRPPARKISLKPQPRPQRQQGPPPAYRPGQGRGGPSHGRGHQGAGRPPPYNLEMHQVHGHNHV